ncbi:MAG: hypothetical protein ACK52U_11155 [Synechococcaceae cyanobacterium]|jgi:hypothetical protein
MTTTFGLQVQSALAAFTPRLVARFAPESAILYSCGEARPAVGGPFGGRAPLQR